MPIRLSCNDEISLKWWTFPGGERSVKILETTRLLKYTFCSIHCQFKGSDDLIDILLLVNAIRNINPKTRIRLTIPYFPFARQDRVMTEGEPFALQVAVNLINSCNFDEVEIWDAHSDVLAGMFSPGKLRTVSQWNLMESVIKYSRTINSCLVSPDAGAMKKIYKLAKIMNMPVIEATKVRDVSTGEIKSTKIDPDAFLVTYDKLFVVDDICDGGRTFIELGNEIRKHYQGELILVVTHGIFSKGREVFDGLYNQVVALNNMDKED